MEQRDQNRRMAQLLFPHITKTPEDYEAIYPERDLPEGAMVTRIAPSPTGFMHFGNLYGALIDERLAHQSGGVFYLRIENTDSKREVEGAVEVILTSLNAFGLKFDEGATEGEDRGTYGPYRQRDRAELYQTIAKSLVERGMAYPCFCTEEDLQVLHDKQEASGANFGYYGEWAVHANITCEEAEALIAEGKPYVVRFRSPGKDGNRIKYKDLAKGEIEMPENCNDIVLLKSDGIPTYHFAHVVDDHFMRTTHVVRGEEWLSTFPYHLQMFDAIGWKKPAYVHTAHMLKQDGSSKRKLSKRKDPEARLTYYLQEGYPAECVIEYLMTVLNSNFEEWRRKNPDADLNEFRFKAEKMGVAGAVFDIDKLNDISKTVISKMSGEQVYDATAVWAKEYNPEFYALLTRDPAYSKAILSIGRGGKKPRKDFTVWSDVPDYMAFFFEETFQTAYPWPENMSKNDILRVLNEYPSIYDEADDQQTWFNKVKDLTAAMGYAVDMKAYKADPTAFPGSVADISAVLRVAITGRTASPDTYAVMNILGKETVLDRLSKAAAAL
ncbi:MAG: glutamate--tRNA ligase [Clostridia bacterium]|nr:glutamate--tRNA ligase [Clostridia bacterium]MBQ5820853.1 glutamate--tRNA ligase [Clostridia bacterium]